MAHPIDKLDVHQIGALMRWKHWHGRIWKADLRRAWESGDYEFAPQDVIALLQQVRNCVGSSGLSRIILK